MGEPFLVFTGPITAEELEIRRALGLFEDPHKILTENDMMKCAFLNEVTDAPLYKHSPLLKDINISNIETSRSTRRSVLSKYSSTVRKNIKSRNSDTFYSTNNGKSTYDLIFENSFLRDFDLTYDSTKCKSWMERTRNVTIRDQTVSDERSFVEGFDTFDDSQVSHKFKNKSKKQSLIKKLMHKKYKYANSNISHQKKSNSSFHQSPQRSTRAQRIVDLAVDQSKVEESDIDSTLGNLEKNSIYHNSTRKSSKKNSLNNMESEHNSTPKRKYQDVNVEEPSNGIDFIPENELNLDESSIQKKSIKKNSNNCSTRREQSDLEKSNSSFHQSPRRSTRAQRIVDLAVDQSKVEESDIDSTLENLEKTSIYHNSSRKSSKKNSLNSIMESEHNSTPERKYQDVNVEDPSNGIDFIPENELNLDESSIQKKSIKKNSNNCSTRREQSDLEKSNSSFQQSSRRSTRGQKIVDLAVNQSKVEELSIDSTLGNLEKSSNHHKSFKKSSGGKESYLPELLLFSNYSPRREQSDLEKSISSFHQSPRRSTRAQRIVDLAVDQSKVEESDIDSTLGNLEKNSIYHNSTRKSSKKNSLNNMESEHNSTPKRKYQDLNVEDPSKGIDFIPGNELNLDESPIQKKSIKKNSNNCSTRSELSGLEKSNQQSSKRSTRGQRIVDLAVNQSKVEESSIDLTLGNLEKSSNHHKSFRKSSGGKESCSPELLLFSHYSPRREQSDLEKSNSSFQHSFRSTRGIIAQNKMEDSTLGKELNLNKSSIKNQSLRKTTQNKENSLNAESELYFTPNRRRLVHENLMLEDPSFVEESMNIISGNEHYLDKSSNQKKSIRDNGSCSTELNLSPRSEPNGLEKCYSSFEQSLKRITRSTSIVEITAEDQSNVEKSMIDSTIENLEKSSNHHKSLRQSSGDKEGFLTELSCSARSELSELEKYKSSFEPSLRRSIRVQSTVNETVVNQSNVDDSTLGKDVNSEKITIKNQSLNKSIQNKENSLNIESRDKKNSIIDLNCTPRIETSELEKSNSSFKQSSRRSTKGQSIVNVIAVNQSKVEESDIDSTVGDLEKSSNHHKSIRKSSKGKESCLPKNEQSRLEKAKSSFEQSLRSTRGKSDLFLMSENQTNVGESDIDFTLGNELNKKKNLRKSSRANETVLIDFNHTPKFVPQNLKSNATNTNKQSKLDIDYILGNELNLEKSSNQNKSFKQSSQYNTSCLIDFNTPKQPSEKLNSSLQQSSRRSTRAKSVLDLLVEEPIASTPGNEEKSSRQSSGCKKIGSNVELSVEDPPKVVSHFNSTPEDLEKSSIQGENLQRCDSMRINFTPVSGNSDENVPSKKERRYGIKYYRESIFSPQNTNSASKTVSLKRKSEFDESLNLKKLCPSTSSNIKNNSILCVTPLNRIPQKQTLSSQSRIPIFKKPDVSSDTTPRDGNSTKKANVSKLPKLAISNVNKCLYKK